MTELPLPEGVSLVPVSGTRRQTVHFRGHVLGTLTPDPDEGFWVEGSLLPGTRDVANEREGVFYLLGMLQASLVLGERAGLVDL
ncbi:hypothetical protein [Kitasatospora purpeofusca]|uniref:hypothetical protein n=1 Tax=Kitasatospora purpeofusca TaxID=67352 RepID=UPI0037FE8F58